MMKFLVLGLLSIVVSGWAADWPADTPLPQDAMMPPVLREIVAQREDIQQVTVLVDMRLGTENPRWVMSQTQMQVLLRKLAELPDVPRSEDQIWPKLPRKDAAYKGVVLLLETVDGRRFAPLRIFEGKLLDGKKTLGKDYGRMLEYWLFGTARVRRDQLLGVNVLPVISFEQCRIMGQKVVETTPRQCLLPDNNLLLETSERPTVASARLRDFDECLKSGVALIYTFPRRCVAAGGRGFTEPPRVLSTPVVVTPSVVVSGEMPNVPGAPVPFDPSAVVPNANSASDTAVLRAVVAEVVSLTEVSPTVALVSGSVVETSATRYNWRELGK